MKKLLIAAGFVLAATSASWAQDYSYGPGYGYADPGYYASSPYAPGPGYYAPGPYGVDRTANNWQWDRVSGPGRGMSAESQR